MKKIKKELGSRDCMVEAALSLFHEHGIHATSVDAVLERSGTGKSQFTHYFKNKDGLVFAVLSYFYDKMLEGAYSPFPSIETWAQLEKFLRSFIQWQETVDCGLSCPIGTISHDLSEHQEEIRALAKKIFKWRRNYVANFFKQEQRAGRLQKTPRPQALADFCYTLIQGGLWMSKAERNTKSFENAVTIAMAHLKSLRT